jgi:putative ATP-binding cassette transporter
VVALLIVVVGVTLLLLTAAVQISGALILQLAGTFLTGDP